MVESKNRTKRFLTSEVDGMAEPSSIQRSHQSSASRSRCRRSRHSTVFLVGFLLGILITRHRTRLSLPSRFFDAAATDSLLRTYSVGGDGDGSGSGSGNSEQRYPERIYFSHQPTHFITEFARCAKTKRCKLLYWHVQKTGGTYLASRLYKILNRDQRGYQSKEWCCHESFMRHKFRANTTKYCTTNFGVYEVRPNQYREIVNTCLRHQQQQQQQQQQQFKVEEGGNEDDEGKVERLEYMGLMTIREPLQRTISQIHQQCNVRRNSHLKPKDQEICNRCRYDGVDSNGGQKNDNGGKDDDDRSFYDHIANTTNKIYQEMKNMVEIQVDDKDDYSLSTMDDGVQTQEKNRKEKKYLNLPLLILNNEDMDEFFDGLERHVTSLLSNKQVATATTTFPLPSFSIFPKISNTNLNDDDDDDFVDDGPYHLPKGRMNAQKREVVTGENDNSTVTTTKTTTKSIIVEGQAQSSTSPKLCNFAMPSQLMKLHRPSLDIYRWFQRQQ